VTGEPTPGDLAVDSWWRAYAILLGAIANQDAVLPVDVNRAFRVADLVCGEPPDPET